jgi:uracil-DNA glycosylase
VFITNVVKCRPPGNRDPEPDEMAACAPWLRRQLEVLDPALIVTLGRFSMATFLPGSRIGQAHGTMRPVDPATGARDAMAYAMYHPAAAFRQGGLKETMKLDMLGVPEALTRARERRAERAADAATAPPPAPRGAAAVMPAGPTRVESDEPSPEELDALFASDPPGDEESTEDRDQMGMFS